MHHCMLCYAFTVTRGCGRLGLNTTLSKRAVGCQTNQYRFSLLELLFPEVNAHIQSKYCPRQREVCTQRQHVGEWIQTQIQTHLSQCKDKYVPAVQLAQMHCVFMQLYRNQSRNQPRNLMHNKKKKKEKTVRSLVCLITFNPVWHRSSYIFGSEMFLKHYHELKKKIAR